MKSIAIIVTFFLLAMPAFSQSLPDANVERDSINNVIKRQLNLSKPISDSLSGILQRSSSSMAEIMRGSFSKDEKLSKIKSIAADRDRKIEALLSDKQVVRLKEIMSSFKEAMKSRRSAQKYPKSRTLNND